MIRLIFIILVGILSVLAGGVYCATVIWSPMPERMLPLSFLDLWIIPLLPGVVCAFVGGRILSRGTQAPALSRLWLSLIQVGLLAAVITALVKMAISSDPVREIAFNWSIYSLFFTLAAYKAEQLMWLKHD